MLDRYVNALLSEIQIASSRLDDTKKSIETIYFGGGTPSLMSPSQIEAVLKHVQQHFVIGRDTEITLEANPGTTNFQKLAGYRQAGVNRLSFGVQSFIESELSALGRIHCSEEALEEIKTAKQAGFQNISLDLIYGLPGQDMAAWLRNLETALSLGIQHLSLYGLILEEETPLYLAVHKGKVSLPDDDLVADMFDMARLRLEEVGWQHYEISNWAKAIQYESAHNKSYWLNGQWLGLGVAAHSHIRNLRFSNTGSIENYIQSLEDTSIASIAGVVSPVQNWMAENDTTTEMRETMMLGFRLLQDGVDLKAFANRFGTDAEVFFSKEIAYLTKRGLIEKITGEGNPKLRLSEAAVGVANQVFREFV